VSRQHLKWDVCSRAWVSEEERVEIPDIGGHTSVDRRGLNREPVGDSNLPPREVQYPQQQRDGRALEVSRDADSSQQQNKNKRNVIIGELGHSGRQGREYRGKSTGDHNLPSRAPQLKNQEELTQQVKLKAPVPSAPALLEPKKPITSQSGQTCCVCMTQNIEIIFNCAHAATCEECAKSLCVCPICRADITSRNRIYISGI